LYQLTTEELETLNKNPDNAEVGFQTGEILDLRRNIASLSQTKPFHQESPPLEADESNQILACFFSSYTSLPFMFLSLFVDTVGEKDTVYPLRLYLGIDDGTTLEELKEGWGEIKYWRDYIRKAQGAQMGGPKEEFLFDLHTQNMTGQGYGSLAKDVNKRLENILRNEISGRKWVKQFEEEVQEYLSHQKEGLVNFSKIKRQVQYSFSDNDPEKKQFWLARAYKAAPIKTLLEVPQVNPYTAYESIAQSILLYLGFDSAKSQKGIEECLKDINDGRNMRKIVTANTIRERLRWWRTKYDYPSPGKTDMG